MAVAVREVFPEPFRVAAVPRVTDAPAPGAVQVATPPVKSVRFESLDTTWTERLMKAAPTGVLWVPELLVAG